MLCCLHKSFYKKCPKNHVFAIFAKHKKTAIYIQGLYKVVHFDRVHEKGHMNRTMILPWKGSQIGYSYSEKYYSYADLF